MRRAATIFSSSELARSLQGVWTVVVGATGVDGSTACAACPLADTKESARPYCLRSVGGEPLQELVLDPVPVVADDYLLAGLEPVDESAGTLQLGKKGPFAVHVEGPLASSVGVLLPRALVEEGRVHGWWCWLVAGRAVLSRVLDGSRR